MNYPSKPWTNGQTFIENGTVYVYDEYTNSWNFSPLTYNRIQHSISFTVPEENSSLRIEFSENENFSTSAVVYDTLNSSSLHYFKTFKSNDGTFETLNDNKISSSQFDSIILIPELEMNTRYFGRYRWTSFLGISGKWNQIVYPNSGGISGNISSSTYGEQTKIYEKYQDMINDQDPKFFSWVIDASDDETVNNGAAFYYKKQDGWEKLYESELMSDVSELEAMIKEYRNSTDYSSFEVYPNDQIIPVGDSVILDGYVSEEIPINMVERLFVRTYCPREQLDVSIDWGDGTTTDLSDVNASGITASTPDSDGEYRMYCEHTYEESKKYIVKIYGRNYFSFGHDETCSNLTCRIFSGDLPIALHLRNLSSVCVKALRLLKVVVNGYDAWIENVENMSGAFYMCYNLLSATGFRQRTSMMCDQNLFQQCRNLVTTDYKMKTTYSRPGACDGVFGGCVNLAINNISKLLPDTGFIGSINFSKIFFNCSSLSGIVPASKLWEDSKVTWTNTSDAFIGCSDAIRAQVPISWGGTNQEIENKIQAGYWNLVQKHITDELESRIQAAEKLMDYSSFEVYPNSEEIPVGENEILGGYVNEAIPANMVERFQIRTSCALEDSDIILDWGDGTIAIFNDTDVEGIAQSGPNSSKEWTYTCEHTYTESRKFIVKIYGHKYYSIGHMSGKSSNLMCRVFEGDLPIASHLCNLASFCLNSKRLLYVRANGYDAWSQNAYNLSYLFEGCTNLIECTGFRPRLKSYADPEIFNGCSNLIKTDFQLASIYLANNGGAVYERCPKLAVDILTLLPESGFFGTVSMNLMFWNGSSLTCSNYEELANKLWRNSKVNFINTSRAFEGCSQELREHVPTSWGGTNTEIQAKLDNGYYNLVQKHVVDSITAKTDAISNLTDYSAFEVYAHNTDIPVGYSEELGGDVSVAIPANMTERFHIRAVCPLAKSDLVIDWGDGTQVVLADPDVEHVTATGPDSEKEYTYTVEHTYSTVGKYIVKLYGHCYYSFGHFNGSSNIVCRVFEGDLPIASHIHNFGRLWNYATMLINVQANGYDAWFQNIDNASYVFSGCKNLKKCVGFKYLTSYSCAPGFFEQCPNLEETDFRIASIQTRSDTGTAEFAGCGKLAVNIINLLPKNGFLGSINMFRRFFGCSSLTCSDYDVLASKLWENTKVTWINTAETFKGCSNDLRSHVPISWGGTNQEIEDKLQSGYYNLVQKHTIDSINTKIRVVNDLVDYTAFEVYPNSEAIPVGESEVLGGYVSVEIPANMTEKFYLRENCPKEKSDVIIDWGDGTVVVLADADAEGISLKLVDGVEYQYYCEHTYEESAKYVVKIYGHSYWHIGQDTTITNNNLICRVFEGDLPIASHLHNFSAFCMGANRLIKVEINAYDAWIQQVDNINSCFMSCQNLLECTGFRQRASMMCDQYLFTGCTNLTKTDYKMKSIYSRPGAAGDTFNNCPALAVDISKLLPDIAFFGTINMSNMFKDCASLSGTVPASKLWENSNVTWTNTTNAFKGCSDAIRAQVPTSWGGTNTGIQTKLDNGYYNLIKRGDIILNENVTASNWVVSNTYPEFPYQCSINIENVTENSDVDVVFGLNEALSGNYAPICLAGNGAVTIYSKVNNAIIINKIRVLK